MKRYACYCLFFLCFHAHLNLFHLRSVVEGRVEYVASVVVRGAYGEAQIGMLRDRFIDNHHHDGVALDHYRVSLPLRKGRNRLLIKVENVGYSAWFQARLTDPSGQSPTGLDISRKRR